MHKAQEWGERIPIGVIYRTAAPSYEEQVPALKKGPLVSREIGPKRAEPLFAEFA